MKYPISLTLFFPVYNEEENIHELVEHTVRTVEQSPYINDYEVLIIDDGSSDKTPELADRLAAHHSHVRAIHHARNKGYGAALRTGIAEASKDYVFFTDGDLQFDILELNNLIIHLEDYGDMVVGYRAPRRDPFMRRLNAFGWNVLNRTLFGLKIRDIDCAFKLFRRDMVQKLRLRSKGAMINAEILIRLQRKGIEVKEVPVSHLPRKYGSPTGAKLSVITRALGEMADLYRGDLGLATQKQALKFATVGVLNTLVDMGMYVVLTRGLGLTPFLFAKFLSFMTGTVSSLVLNRTWTFGMRTRITAGEVARFYAMVSISLIANLSAMYLSVRVLGLPDLVGLVTATLVSLGASYTLSRFWVFRPERRPARFALSLPRSRTLLALLLTASALLLVPGYAAHAQDTEDQGNSFDRTPQHAQGNPDSASAQPSAPASPSEPFAPSSFYQSFMPLSPKATTSPAKSTEESTTTTSHTPPVVASSTPTATINPVTPYAPTAPTTPSVPLAPMNNGSALSPLSDLQKILFSGSAYAPVQFSPTATKRLMILAALFAATGITFLGYAAIVRASERRAVARSFRRIPVAAR